MTVSFVIQLPSKNYAGSRWPVSGLRTPTAEGRAHARLKNRRDESLRSTGGRLESATRDPAGDGVAVADVREHFPEGAENAFGGVLPRQKPLAILGQILIDEASAS